MKTERQKGSDNIARFFTHNRQIAWVALLATLGWGVFGYMNMPKRKDPDIPVRIALAITPWQGISAEKVEQLVTRKVEQAVTGNSKVDRVESTTRTTSRSCKFDCSTASQTRNRNSRTLANG